jgi:FkbM family methyltransferase
MKEIYNQLLILGYTPNQLQVNFAHFSPSIVEMDQYVDGYAWAFEHLEDRISRQILLARLEQLPMPLTLPFFRRARSNCHQYFEDGLIHLDEHEIFADCGMYTGDTAEIFIKLTKGKYTKYYGFEPDENNYNKAVKLLSKFDNTILSQKALWECDTMLSFAQGLQGSSKVADNADKFVEAVSLDSFFQDELSPTIVKMDIEGAEKEALLGARQIISQKKPQLAICVYHKPDDVYSLAQIAKNYCDEYRLYLRHYSNHTGETVMYAVAERGHNGI